MILRYLRCLFVVAGAFAGAWLLAPAQSWAQSTWPPKTIRIVVPYPPGTGPDIMARIVAERLGPELKTHLVVDNRPGANAIIGTSEVVRSAPDGHTFLLVDRLTLTVNPLLYKPLPFDPGKDLVSVSSIADVNLYLAVSNALPVKDYDAFIAHVKAHPGQIPFGTGGVGSIMHLNMELLQGGAGVSFLHVPYKALAEVIPAILGGQVMVTSGGVEAMLPYVQTGSLRLLAVGAGTRTPIAPDVPTIKEASGAELLMSTSYSLHARAGTPADVLDRMNAALANVLAQPELRQWAAERGLRAAASTPAALDAQIEADSERIGTLVRERGIKVR